MNKLLLNLFLYSINKKILKILSKKIEKFYEKLSIKDVLKDLFQKNKSILSLEI